MIQMFYDLIEQCTHTSTKHTNKNEKNVIENVMVCTKITGLLFEFHRGTAITSSSQGPSHPISRQGGQKSKFQMLQNLFLAMLHFIWHSQGAGSCIRMALGTALGQHWEPHW